MENNSLSNFLCKLVIDKQLISKAKQQNCYGSKIEKISELSKLLSVKNRMSDDLFHLLASLVSVACYPNCHWRNRTEFPLLS